MNKPNILFITTDQHRGDSLGCSGHRCVQTPHLDQLFHEGVNFTNAYADCPLCIPARTTILTGIHGHNYGCCDWRPDFRIDFPREKFLASMLTRAGYQTELIGKTHWQLDPSDRAGFEHVISYERLYEQRRRELGRPGFDYEGLGYNELYPTLCTVPRHLHGTDWVIDRGLEFLEHRQKNQPFFLWISVHDPHPPLIAYEPYFSMYDRADIPDPVLPDWLDTEECPKWLHDHRWMFNPGPMSPSRVRKARSVYYGMITYVDHQINRLFGRLMGNGLWDDTVVVYASDHGEQLGDYHDVHKSSFYEGSARVPLLVRFPGRYGYPVGQQNVGLVELADLYPTFLQISGCDIPEGIDGRSIMPLVDGTAGSVRDFLHGQHNHSHMIRTPTHKYLYFAEDGAEQVFDMTGDRRDDRNLAGDRTITDRLRKTLTDHLIAEQNTDAANGKLLNEGRVREPVERLRAINPLGWH